MANELVLLFDDLGDMYEVENITEMLTVIDDVELIPIYKATVFEHKLTMANEELVKLGYQTSSNKPYNEEAGERGIKYLTAEVIKRFGDEGQQKILSEVDLSFEKNKPIIPNRKRKKK